MLYSCSMSVHLSSPPLPSPQHSTKPLPSPRPRLPQQDKKPAGLVAAAAAAAVVLHCSPVEAGILSGFGGIESVPGPQLPQVDFLNRWSEEKQRKYAELDQRFKSSSVLKELLEKSKANQERNKRELQDKYCLRGAEWGIGDCSTAGMSDAEKEQFIDMLKTRSASATHQ